MYSLYSVAVAALPLCAHAQDAYGASATVPREAFEDARSRSTASRGELEQTGSDNVGDMLERTGVTVQRTASGSATPILRGLTGSQVLLMHEDLRLNDALTRPGGSALLNLVDPESVSRIEVVHGPASVLYGSDALGGLVHVRTQSTEAGRVDAPQFAGTAMSRAASAERALAGSGAVQVDAPSFGVRLTGRLGSAGRLQPGGGGGLQPYTGHDDWSLSGLAELAHTPRHRVSLVHHSGHLRDMPRSDVSEPEDVQKTASLDRDATVLTYDGRSLAGRLGLHAFAGVSSRREVRTRARPGKYDRERESVTSVQLGLRGSLSAWWGAQLELGADSVVDRVATNNSQTDDMGARKSTRGRYLDGSHYDMHAAYALLTQAVSQRWQVLLGGRATMVVAQASADPLFVEALGQGAELDRVFARPVGALGVRADVSSTLRWVATVQTGFRAPNLEDFQAFGGAARGYTVPNLALDEERSITLETGVEHRDEHLRVEAFVFASWLRGLIVRAPSTFEGMTEVEGEPVISRRNSSNSQMLGAEGGVTYSGSTGLFSSVAGSFTWGATTRPDDAGRRIDEPASKVPPLTAVVRAGFDHPDSMYFGQLALAVQAAQRRLSEGDKSDVRICPQGPEGCDRVPAYTDLTVRAGLRLERRVLLTVAAENLVDSRYRTFASGVYAPGRNYVASLRVRW